jgi:phage shock protein A
MMQVNEIKQRFSNVEQCVRQAEQACSSAQNTPQDLKDCVQQLGQQTNQAKQVMQSQNESQIRQCVDDLEQLSDRAKGAVERSERSGNLDSQVKSAVMQAHSELSNLKHQMH